MSPRQDHTAKLNETPISLKMDKITASGKPEKYPRRYWVLLTQRMWFKPIAAKF